MAVTNNNIARLKEEADIAAVISYLQIKVTKRGSSYFILCPNPEHDDTRPTNCYYKDGWNNIYCCVCGTSTNAVDLIMEVLGVDYGEACDILWEISGCPDWYYVKGQKKKNHFVFKREDAELIGLHYPSHIETPISIKEYKEELDTNESYMHSEVDAYLKCKVNRMNYLDFMSEKEYLYLIMDKCREMVEIVKGQLSFLYDLQQELKTMGIEDDFTSGLISNLSKKKRQCWDLYRRTKKAACKSA